MTNSEARKMYRELFGRAAARSTSHQEIIDAIDLKKEEIMKEEEKREAERQAIWQKEKDRAERIIRRGEDARAFADSWKTLEGDDGEYSYFLRKAFRIIDNFEETKAAFIKKIDEAPLYAMSWSKGFFEEAARYNVAKSVVNDFNYGPTFKDVIEELQRRVIMSARYCANQSTSQTSNLAQQYELQAMAEFIEGY